jgi:hypothetical protein
MATMQQYTQAVNNKIKYHTYQLYDRYTTHLSTKRHGVTSPATFSKHVASAHNKIQEMGTEAA